jgi:pimeloyl-ACP methyl ester carboxylesterase
MNNDIVLIRGLFRGQYHWGEFAQLLNELLPDQRVIAVDIPGTGSLSGDKSPCSIEGMVESVRFQLASNTQVDIVAISMGGMIALKWAEMYPDQVRRVICINTSSRGISPFYQRLKPANYINIIKALLSGPEKKESIIYSMVSNKPFSQQVIDDWVLLGKLYPTTTMNFLRQLFAAIKFKAKRPNNEILFISSLEDSLVSNSATQSLAQAWDMPIIYNHGDGHDIPLDNPEWLAYKVIRYLKLDEEQQKDTLG